VSRPWRRINTLYSDIIKNAFFSRNLGQNMLKKCIFLKKAVKLPQRLGICPPKSPLASSGQGRRHEGDWGETVPPLLTKIIFVNRLKPIIKYWGYGGVTSPTIFEFQPEIITSGFQRQDPTYILSNLLTNFVLLNLLFYQLK